MIGMDGRRLAADVARAAGMPIDAAAMEVIDDRAGVLFDERNRAPRPLPGARAAVAVLDRAGVTWAIATSSRAEQVAASIAGLELDQAPHIVDGSAVEHAKKRLLTYSCCRRADWVDARRAVRWLLIL